MSTANQHIMKEDIINRGILLASYFSTAGVWVSHFGVLFKISLTIIATLTTVMAFMNQFQTFQKNYRTLWLVITIDHVFTLMRLKKRRHRKNNFPPKKDMSK